MTTATINRSEIFRAAWSEVKAYFARCAERGLEPLHNLHQKLAYELRLAWSHAKSAVHHARINAAPRADQLRAEISAMENKDTWSETDYATHSRLVLELREATEDANTLDQEAKRQLIESAAGQFASVTFIKKDGTKRTMTVQPAALKFRVKGEAGQPFARKAAALRRSRHPHLMPVWDVEAQAVRSINLATVKTITTGGMAYAYA